MSYAMLGFVVLVRVAGLSLTILNWFLFLVGAFAGGLALLFVYGHAIASNQLSAVALYGLFPVLMIGGAAGGTLFVWAKTRFTKSRRPRPNRES
jgi:hypothetical protein